MNLYLVKLPDERPPMHADLVYHPVRMFCNKAVCDVVTAGTYKRAWVWSDYECRTLIGAGWLLERWEGLIIDRSAGCGLATLPDGNKDGVWHPHIAGRELPFELTKRAVWWSSRPLPEWLAARGVRPVEEAFWREQIAQDERFAYRDRHPRIKAEAV